jgi:hypothetical protein
MNRTLLALVALLTGATACNPKLDIGNMNASGGGGADPSTTSGSDAGGAGSGGAHAGGGSTGTMMPPTPCVPAAGTQALDFDTPSGTTMQVGILANSGAKTRLAFLGTVPNYFAGWACALVDSVELVENGSTLQTIDAGGVEIPKPSPDNDTDRVPWLEADAASAVSARCGDTSDNGRVDTVGVLVRGRMDGGTFVARVGRATLNVGSWGWPPAVVLTCSQGLDGPAIYGDVLRDLGPQTGPATTLLASFALHAGQPKVQSFSGTVDIVPVAAPPIDQPFDDHTQPLTPIHSSGWTSEMMDTQLPGGSSLRRVQLRHDGDPIGNQGCPAPSGSPPNPTPVIVARLTGTTNAGPFSAEVFTHPCAPSP